MASQQVLEYPKGKQGSIMVWAAIGGTGTIGRRSELIVMERDAESKKNGYTTTSYLNTLYWGLLPIYRNELFMHPYRAYCKGMNQSRGHQYLDRLASIFTGFEPH